MEIDRRSAEVWASWFRCLADPSRVLLLNRLAAARRPMTVGELVAAVDIGQPTVSHHLKLLADVGFVHHEAKANTSLWSVNERCLERFPSAAELIMGVLPRYEQRDMDCVPPWQHDEVTATTSRRRNSRAPLMPEPSEIEDAVRRRYAAAAKTASACCSVPDAFGADGAEVYGAARYEPGDLDGLPAEVVAASIGCANPVAVADLHPGETVLDLGAGGGIDVLLSARRVGPTGKAYGVDMTDEMLALARANQQRPGVTNAEFLRGHIENVPLSDASVDVIVSNCVINLSPDKPAVFAEAYRLLRPGGRLAVADVVADAAVDDERRADLSAWTDCIAGAVTRGEYQSMLEAAGFVDVQIDDSHPVADGFTSAIVRAAIPVSHTGRS